MRVALYVGPIIIWSLQSWASIATKMYNYGGQKQISIKLNLKCYDLT